MISLIVIWYNSFEPIKIKIRSFWNIFFFCNVRKLQVKCIVWFSAMLLKYWWDLSSTHLNRIYLKFGDNRMDCTILRDDTKFWRNSVTKILAEYIILLQDKYLRCLLYNKYRFFLVFLKTSYSLKNRLTNN